MTGLQSSIDRLIAETGFSGVVHVSLRHHVLVERASGLSDRDRGVANTAATRFCIASGSKGFTALAVMSLVNEGSLSLDTRVRAIAGDTLPLVDERVTVEHLLAHTSGIGEYIDEAAIEDIDDFILPVPVDQLASTSDYLSVLRGHPPKFEPGQRFEYSDSGYVVLALVSEAASGRSFHDLAADRVFEPAEMAATAFTRLDRLGDSDAVGYVPTKDGWRTNRMNLPVRGSGDGGAFSTVADMATFWQALFDGRFVPRELVDEMVKTRSDVPSEGKRYGLGFWLRSDRPTVMLEGYDAGVSFRSAFDPPSGFMYTVMSNTSRGAWPLVKLLDGLLPELAGSGRT